MGVPVHLAAVALQLQVERHRSRVEVSDRTAVAVTARQATLRSLLTAEVTGAPILSFAVRLPASLRVSQVRVPPAPTGSSVATAGASS